MKNEDAFRKCPWDPPSWSEEKEATEGSQTGYTDTGTLLTLSESLGPSIAGHLISTQTAGVGISYSTLDADESTIYLPGS